MGVSVALGSRSITLIARSRVSPPSTILAWVTSFGIARYDFSPAKAVFSIFRRTSEVPLYRIEKDPKLARKQGAFSVIAATGLILKRGSELKRVIDVLDKRLKLVSG